MGRHFTTDCEGPISKNDNAQELTAHFLPRGESFFAKVSKYDDFLADVIQRPGYRAGDTLKLILPFLTAFGASNAAIEDYSRSHIILLPGAAEMLGHVGQQMASFIISTSYEPYIRALCEVLHFPVSQAFFTCLDIDRYTLDPNEQRWLRETAQEIAEMETLDWDEGVKDIGDLPETHQRTLERLERIFWETIPDMSIGRVFDEVTPVGGEEKARAVLKSLEGSTRGLEDVIYIGDSITDTQALDLVREHGGVAVSFNGNSYAIRSAEICCLSKDARAIAVLADIFNREGRDGALDLVSSWTPDALSRLSIRAGLLDWLTYLPRQDFPRIERICDTNRADLTTASEAFRKSVRGVEIGSLG
jgi:energy-converting hydrogenase A subunit R